MAKRRVGAHHEHPHPEPHKNALSPVSCGKDKPLFPGDDPQTLEGLRQDVHRELRAPTRVLDEQRKPCGETAQQPCWPGD